MPSLKDTKSGSKGYEPLGSGDSKLPRSEYMITNTNSDVNSEYRRVWAFDTVEESDDPKHAKLHRSQAGDLCTQMGGIFDRLDWSSYQAHETAFETRLTALVKAHPNAHTTIAYKEPKVGSFSRYYDDPAASVKVTITSTDGKIPHRSVTEWAKDKVWRPADEAVGNLIDAGDEFLFPRW